MHEAFEIGFVEIVEGRADDCVVIIYAVRFLGGIAQNLRDRARRFSS
jgi:hypothetical protein